MRSAANSVRELSVTSLLLCLACSTGLQTIGHGEQDRDKFPQRTIASLNEELAIPGHPLEAMSEVGADRRAIDGWVARIRAGASFDGALAGAQLPAGVRAFLATTAAILLEPLAVRAAAFHHSRESVMPEMFLPIAENLDGNAVRCPTLIAYLRRHVMLDSGEHSLASEQMVRRLLEASPEHVARAQEVSVQALVARAALWNALLGGIQAGAPEVDDGSSSGRLA